MKSNPLFQKHATCFDGILIHHILCDQITMRVIHPLTDEALFLIS